MAAPPLTYWGIDVATTRVALGTIPQPLTYVAAWKKPAGAPRLRELRSHVLEGAHMLKQSTGRPMLVMVENPVLAGRGGGQGLLHAVGVTIEAVSEVVGCPVLDRDVQSWHRQLGIGPGKAEVIALVLALHPELAGLTEDELETIAMAYSAAVAYEER